MIVNGGQSSVQQPVSTSDNSVSQGTGSEGFYRGKAVTKTLPASMAKMPVLQRLARGEDGILRFEGKTPVISTSPPPATLPVVKQIVRPKGDFPRLQDRTQAPETPPTLTRLDPWAGRVRTSSPMPDTQPAPPTLKRFQQHSGASLPTDYAKMPALIAIEDIVSEPMDVTESGRCDQDLVAANNVTSQMHKASEEARLSALPDQATENYNDPELCERRYPDTKHLTIQDIKEVRRWRDDRLRISAGELGRWRGGLAYFISIYGESIANLATKYGKGSRMYELAVAECIEQYHTAMTTGLWRVGRSLAHQLEFITHEIRKKTYENQLLKKKGSDPYLIKKNAARQAIAAKYRTVSNFIGQDYAAAENLYIQKSPQVFVNVQNNKELMTHPELVSDKNKVLSTLSISRHSALLKRVRANQQANTEGSMVSRPSSERENRRFHPY